MSEQDATAFAASPYADDACRLRRWDDAAKEPDAPTPPFEQLPAPTQRALLEGLLTDRVLRAR